MAGRHNKLGDPFESFIGCRFKKLGCQVEEQPISTGEKRADFLVNTPNGDEFYIEATVVAHRPFSDKPTENDVCEKLNQMCHNPGQYWFNAFADGNLERNLSRHDLSPIKKWIDGLNNKEIGKYAESFEFPCNTSTDKWRVEILATPRSKNMRGIQSLLLPGFERSGGIDSRGPIYRAARSKARQHKSIKKPLLLVMNDVGDFPSDRLDVAMALFGWEQDVPGESNVLRITPTSPTLRRKSIWGSGENKTISAILLFHEWTPHAPSREKMCLYENPRAYHPAPSWLRETFPHASLEEDEGIQYLHWPSD